MISETYICFSQESEKNQITETFISENDLNLEIEEVALHSIKNATKDVKILE